MNTKDVLYYLNHLKKLKQSIVPPQSLEIDEGLYHIFDGDGKPVAIFSEDVYKLFQEI